MVCPAAKRSVRRNIQHPELQVGSLLAVSLADLLGVLGKSLGFVLVEFDEFSFSVALWIVCSSLRGPLLSSSTRGGCSEFCMAFASL